MRWLLAAMAAALALAGVGFEATASAEAANVRLPNCGNSWYGGRVAPSNWDRGCTGFTDLTRGHWSQWGKAVAYGRGYEWTSFGVFPVRIRASGIRVCETENWYGTFYTRVWMKKIGLGGRSYRLSCG